MTETLVDLVRTTFEDRTSQTIFVCPGCGSFLDAPRVDPATGELGRKCAPCREWRPVETFQDEQYS